MVIHYKCPNCGSDMVFDSDTGMLTCQSCGNKTDIESFPRTNIKTVFEERDGREYHCKNCGAMLITDTDTTATNCSFCGAGVVLLDRLAGSLAPSKVIPFKISKDQARRAFKKWCKNGLLTPKGFMTGDRVKGITGMYVPFWLYDLNSKVEVNATGTKIRKYTRGDYIYTEASYYDIYRDLTVDYLKVPIDASEKMDDKLMDKLEPYHYNELKDFNTPYLAGFIAEKYNFDYKELLPRAISKIRGYIDTYISSTISGYTAVNYTRKDINTDKTNVYYTLLPVWMVYYDYKGSEYTFAMNGQTGKVVGKPPLSRKRMFTWFSGIAASTFITLKILSVIMGGGLW